MGIKSSALTRNYYKLNSFGSFPWNSALSLKIQKYIKYLKSKAHLHVAIQRIFKDFRGYTAFRWSCGSDSLEGWGTYKHLKVYILKYKNTTKSSLRIYLHFKTKHQVRKSTLRDISSSYFFKHLVIFTEINI